MVFVSQQLGDSLASVVSIVKLYAVLLESGSLSVLLVYSNSSLSYYFSFNTSLIRPIIQNTHTN